MRRRSSLHRSYREQLHRVEAAKGRQLHVRRALNRLEAGRIHNGRTARVVARKKSASSKLSDINRTLFSSKITELVDLNWFEPAPASVFPCVCAKKYDGHFALVRLTAGKKEYIVLAEMCSVRGFTAVKSNISRRGDTSQLYYKLFDMIRHPDHGDVRRRKYPERLELLKKLCSNTVTVLEQRSRARRASGNADVPAVRGLVLHPMRSSTRPQKVARLGSTLSVVDYKRVQNDTQAKRHAQRWAKEVDGEGAVLSPVGPMAVRFKRKPRFDGEIRIAKINRNKQNVITSVSGKHPDGTGPTINVRGTRLPQTLRKGEIITYWSHYGQSGRSNTVYDPTLDVQHGQFQRRRNDDAYKAAVSRVRKPARKPARKTARKPARKPKKSPAKRNSTTNKKSTASKKSTAKARKPAKKSASSASKSQPNRNREEADQNLPMYAKFLDCKHMPTHPDTRRPMMACMAQRERENHAREDAGNSYCYWLPPEGSDQHAEAVNRVKQLRKHMNELKKQMKLPAAPTATELFLALPDDDEVRMHLSTPGHTVKVRNYTISVRAQRVETQSANAACWVPAVWCDCPAFRFGNSAATMKLARGQPFDGAQGSTTLSRKKTLPAWARLCKHTESLLVPARRAQLQWTKVGGEPKIGEKGWHEHVRSAIKDADDSVSIKVGRYRYTIKSSAWGLGLYAAETIPARTELTSQVPFGRRYYVEVHSKKLPPHRSKTQVKRLIRSHVPSPHRELLLQHIDYLYVTPVPVESVGAVVLSKKKDPPSRTGGKPRRKARFVHSYDENIHYVLIEDPYEFPFGFANSCLRRPRSCNVTVTGPEASLITKRRVKKGEQLLWKYSF